MFIGRKESNPNNKYLVKFGKWRWCEETTGDPYNLKYEKVFVSWSPKLLSRNEILCELKVNQKQKSESLIQVFNQIWSTSDEVFFWVQPSNQQLLNFTGANFFFHQTFFQCANKANSRWWNLKICLRSTDFDCQSFHVTYS